MSVDIDAKPQKYVNMKEYRAIYNTQAHNGIMYDFWAKSDDQAVKFANIKFAPECQNSLRLFQGEREVSYKYDEHKVMSIAEKEVFVGAKYVK